MESKGGGTPLDLETEVHYVSALGNSELKAALSVWIFLLNNSFDNRGPKCHKKKKP